MYRKTQTIYEITKLVLGECLLRHVGSLSTTLQRRNLSAAEGQSVSSTTVKTLASYAQRHKLTCWADVMSKVEDREIEEPRIPRRR